MKSFRGDEVLHYHTNNYQEAALQNWEFEARDLRDHKHLLSSTPIPTKNTRQCELISC